MNIVDSYFRTKENLLSYFGNNESEDNIFAIVDWREERWKISQGRLTILEKPFGIYSSEKIYVQSQWPTEEYTLVQIQDRGTDPYMNLLVILRNASRSE